MDSEFKKGYCFLATLFFIFFLLLAPLGTYNEWVPPAIQKGFYSISVIDRGDDSGYYAYLRSIFIDGDLDFINERDFAHHETFTSTGYVFNNWQFGQSVFFIPFFILGHWVACLLKAFGYPVTTDGYSFPYYIVTALGSQTYLFAGLVITWNLLKKRFKEPIPKLATISIWLGTFLLYYSFIRQRMAHTQEFFVAAVFVSYWLKIRTNDKKSEHVLLGAILGILCCIRVINIGYFALYFIDQWFLTHPSSIAFFWERIKLSFTRSLYFLGAFAIAFLPQNYIWFKLDGMPLPAFHSELAGSSINTLSLENIFAATFNFFFSLKWGLFISAPLLFIGILGIIINRKKIQDIQAGLLAGIAAFILIIVFLFNYLDAYEYRYLSPTLPLFAIGLGAIFDKFIQNKKIWIVTLFFIGICFLIQYFMIIQYKITIPYNHPEFTFKSITTIPQILSENVQLLLRSSNWIRLFTLEKHEPWNYKDYIYLVFFPLVQGGIIFLIYYFYSKIISLKAEQRKWFHPKYLSGIIFSISILLIVLVAITAPAKTKEEINVRNQYSELLKTAYSLTGQNQFEDAIVSYQKASNLGLELWTPQLKLALIYQSKKDYAKSNRNFQEVLKLNPYHQSALINLGVNFNILGDYQKAEELLNLAIRQEPRRVEAFDTLGQIYANQNKWVRSERMFKIAYALNPQYTHVQLNLAVLYTQMKKAPEAIYHLKKALNFGIYNNTVEKLLKVHGLRIEKVPK